MLPQCQCQRKELYFPGHSGNPTENFSMKIP